MNTTLFIAKPKRSRYSRYSHLSHLAHKLSVYEIATSELLYYPKIGFETNTPISAWMQKQQNGQLKLENFEKFSDPLEMTYAKYTALRKEEELLLEKCFNDNKIISDEWFWFVENILSPLVFPLHGLQMTTSYLAHLAPSGKVVVPLMFQAADTLKQIHKIAMLGAHYRKQRLTFAKNRKQQWEQGEIWQGLRKVIEELLITYDWGESFVALNFCVKPAIEEVFFDSLFSLAKKNNDTDFEETFLSITSNRLWHRDCVKEILKIILTYKENIKKVSDITSVWSKKMTEALSVFQPLLKLDNFLTDTQKFQEDYCYESN